MIIFYEVGTFGIDTDIGVYASMRTTTNPAFDKGELEILTIDTNKSQAIK